MGSNRKRYVIDHDFPEYSSEVSPNSAIQVFDEFTRLKTLITWVCKFCGDDWKMSIADRQRGRGLWGCRYCSQAAKGVAWKETQLLKKSLADACPEIFARLSDNNITDPKKTLLC